MNMPDLDRPELQRLRYWQGQTLRSRDFRDQMAVEAQLRWWHNRALHNAYGIVEGFEVEQNGEGVLIRRGLAYDCFGRELILTADMLFSRPEGSVLDAGMTLLARYRETRQFPRKDEIAAACAPNQALTAERPEFFWKRTGLMEIRDGVPLARLGKDGNLKPVRLQARPLARPQIATGTTIPGNTAWELWEEPLGREPIPLGFQVIIDTSAAGFTEVPCYFAWLQGPLWPPISPDFFPVLFEHIDSPSTTVFIFRIWMPSLPVPDDNIFNKDFESRFPEFARKRELFVCWLGIQPENEAGELKEIDHGIS
jgi:hypothetical protein